MADFSAWGAERMGSRVLEQDQQRAAAHQLAMQQGLQEMAMQQEIQPARAALLRAQAEHAQAQAAEKRRQEQIAQAWMQRQAQGGGQGGEEEGDPFETSARRLSEIADFQAGMGDLESARKTHSTLSSVVARGERAAQNQAATMKTQFETQKAMADKALGYARGARSAEELKLAGDAFEMEFGHRPGIFSIQYSPENLQRALQQGLTERQAAQGRHEQQMEALRNKEVGLRGAQAEASRRRADAYVNLANEKTKRLQRNDGKPSTAASDAQKSEVRNLLRQQHPDLAGDPVELGLATASIASEAVLHAKMNPGMSWEAAKTEAYMKQRENIQGKKFNVVGRTASTALPMPKDPKEARVGAYYQTSRGPLRYLGNKQFAPATSRSGSIPEPDEDPDED